jgi:hypothetical protein
VTSHVQHTLVEKSDLQLHIAQRVPEDRKASRSGSPIYN